MTEIIDIHSHILPGLDDGPRAAEESLEMLKAAWEQGITGVIATPHHSGRYPNEDPVRIRRTCEKLQDLLEKRQIPIRVYTGQELTCQEDLPDRLKQGKVLTMADSRYILLEFPPYVPYLTILYAVQDLRQAGYLPILAHVERYRTLYAREKIDELRKKGAYMQMNYCSVTGRCWDRQVRRCRSLLRSGRIDFMGTDMHDMTERTPRIKEACRWMEKHLDKTYLEELLSGNAKKLLADRR